MEFTPIILVHTIAALAAIVIGGITLKMKKGTPLHRLLGRAWVVVMLAAALVSFGIRTSGHFSWIHLLSAGVLAGLAAAVFAAVKGRIRMHERIMVRTYAGLVVAGALTFLPARRLGHLVWHAVGLI